MTDQVEKKRLLAGRLRVISLVLTALGVFAFLLALSTKRPDTMMRAWQAFLINWLFFTGMAMGGVVFAAILEVTGSVWGRPMKRIAESMSAFLPVSLFLFPLIFVGMPLLYPWVEAPIPGLENWLDRKALFIRDGTALLALYLVSLYYVYHSIRPDLSGRLLDQYRNRLVVLLRRRWKGSSDEVKRSGARRTYSAPILLIVYALAYSLIGYDLVMSLTPAWYSTLFGAYICIINIFGALAMVALLTIWLGPPLGLSDKVGEPQFHDLGKLMFGFCILSLDFFWSQFLVIWYGNLPEETGYALVRAFKSPWVPVTWTVLFGTFVAPFILLLRRRMKTEPKKLFAVSLWIVVMIWLERFILVAPSSWKWETLPLGVLELIVTAGFLGLFLLALTYLLRRVPAAPLSDPLLREAGKSHHVIGEPERMPKESPGLAPGGER